MLWLVVVVVGCWLCFLFLFFFFFFLLLLLLLLSSSSSSSSLLSSQEKWASSPLVVLAYMYLSGCLMTSGVIIRLGHSVRSTVSSPYTFWSQGGNALTQREKTKKRMRQFFGCPWNIPSRRYPPLNSIFRRKGSSSLAVLFCQCFMHLVFNTPRRTSFQCSQPCPLWVLGITQNDFQTLK